MFNLLIVLVFNIALYSCSTEIEDIAVKVITKKATPVTESVLLPQSTAIIEPVVKPVTKSPEPVINPVIEPAKATIATIPVPTPKSTMVSQPVITPVIKPPEQVIKPVTESAKYVYDVTIKPSDVKRYIPTKANAYLPIVKKEAARLMPDLKTPYYFGGLIEHESCIHLTHSRCWSPTSELKTSRELGIGVGQLTKAFREDGSIRFDSLTEIRNKHQQELKELSWSNIKLRPDLQIRAMVLMIHNNYKTLYKVTNQYERLAMTDAAYNGGLGGLNKERTACGLAKGCDPQFWFGHIENHCLKSKKVLYASRSACDINRKHVFLTFERMPKYKPYF